MSNGKLYGFPIKQYLRDTGKWQVLMVAERVENDKIIGSYDTKEEAAEVVRQYEAIGFNMEGWDNDDTESKMGND